MLSVKFRASFHILLSTALAVNAFQLVSGKLPRKASTLVYSTSADPSFVTQRPLILLDVDGVIVQSLNYGHYKAEQDKVLREEKRITEVPYKDLDGKYLSSPTVVSNINKWSSMAELIWLTSWEESARTELAPLLQIVDFPFSPLATFTEYGRLKKPQTALAHVLESHPSRLIIWVDDELGYFKNNRKDYDVDDPAFDALFNRPNTVFVSPFNGLCPEHVDLINDVLANPEVVQGKCIDKFYPGEQYFLRG